MTTYSYFTLDVTTIDNNYANETSTIQILDSSKLQNNTIRGCYFENNRAVTKTFSIMNSKTLIKRTQFTFN